MILSKCFSGVHNPELQMAFGDRLMKLNLFSKARIEQLAREIGVLQVALSESQIQSRSAYEYGNNQIGELGDHYGPLLERNAQKINTVLDSWPLALLGGWDNHLWRSWTAKESCEVGLLREGSRVEPTPSRLRVPAFVPFIGRDITVIIASKQENASQGAALLQSLAIRTALMLPYLASYTLLDPATAGRAFPMRRYLPHVGESSPDVRADLQQVMQHIQRINETYLDAAITSFEKIPPEVRINERFQFVFAADFPNQYDRRAIEALQHIGLNGPAAGVYLFIHYNTVASLPRDMDMADFKNALFVDLSRHNQQGEWDLEPDAAPEADLQRYLFEQLTKAKPREHALDWDSNVGLPEQEWWRGTTEQLIETPIGAHGGTQKLKLWFGERPESQPCVHGMLGAMPGAGKSNLLHVLIAGLAIRYSPSELRLYLVDGKDGVEFSPYRRLPHCEVISLKTPAELSRSVITELTAELERRNGIFTRVKVPDLRSYRAKGQSEGKLPRILLLVDEYQELFDDDREGVASSCLKTLAEKGRSAGIHMFLVSHRFGEDRMLYKAAIVGSIHMRAAMQMTPTDVQALTEFGRRGKNLITGCDLPGKIVVNDRSGDDTGNISGKVCLLSAGRREQLIDRLVEMAATLQGELPQRVVLHGKAQPSLIDNPHLAALLHRSGWPSPIELETLARASTHEGGLDIPDWFSAEHPRVVWLGQDFTVRGQTMMVFRRRMAENALVIGSNNAVRYGMLSAILATLVLNGGPRENEVWIADRSVERTEWNNALRKVHELVLLKAEFKCRFTQDGQEVIGYLDQLIAELERRSRLGEQQRADQASIFAMFTELDRVDSVRRKVGKYELIDSAASASLARLVTEGPPMGIHVVLSFSGVRAMASVVDERHGLMHFRHRVALQMSEDDSHTLMRSRKAAILQLGEPEPVVGLVMDVEQDRAVRFKPYSTGRSSDPAEVSFEDQLRAIGSKLGERSGAEWKAWTTSTGSS
jgi:DNA segregation ATPase FtsK/SpoIIIE, S-DNA-T family